MILTTTSDIEGRPIKQYSVVSTHIGHGIIEWCKNLFGGRFKSTESVITQTKNEALAGLKAKAKH